MISRGVREAIKQNSAEKDNSRSTKIETTRRQDENKSFLSPWSWNISRDCLKAEKELVKEGRRLHPSMFKVADYHDWSKATYPDDFYSTQVMTWQTIYSSLTTESPLAPKHCEVRDLYDHISECTENELKAIPWTPAERKWVKKAVLFKDYCS